MDKQYNQVQFVNKLRIDKTPVTVFLTNGVKLEGKISEHHQDDEGKTFHSIILKRGSQKQLVMSNAISTILPSGVVTNN